MYHNKTKLVIEHDEGASGSQKHTFIWYAGTTVSEIDSFIRARFELDARTPYTLKDSSDDTVVLSPSLPTDMRLKLITKGGSTRPRSSPQPEEPTKSLAPPQIITEPTVSVAGMVAVIESGSTVMTRSVKASGGPPPLRVSTGSLPGSSVNAPIVSSASTASPRNVNVLHSVYGSSAVGKPAVSSPSRFSDHALTFLDHMAQSSKTGASRNLFNGPTSGVMPVNIPIDNSSTRRATVLADRSYGSPTPPQLPSPTRVSSTVSSISAPGSSSHGALTSSSNAAVLAAAAGAVHNPTHLPAQMVFTFPQASTNPTPIVPAALNSQNAVPLHTYNNSAAGPLRNSSTQSSSNNSSQSQTPTTTTTPPNSASPSGQQTPLSASSPAFSTISYRSAPALADQTGTGLSLPRSTSSSNHSSPPPLLPQFSVTQQSLIHLASVPHPIGSEYAPLDGGGFLPSPSSQPGVSRQQFLSFQSFPPLTATPLNNNPTVLITPTSTSNRQQHFFAHPVTPPMGHMHPGHSPGPFSSTMSVQSAPTAHSVNSSPQLMQGRSPLLIRGGLAHAALPPYLPNTSGPGLPMAYPSPAPSLTTIGSTNAAPQPITNPGHSGSTLHVPTGTPGGLFHSESLPGSRRGSAFSTDGNAGVSHIQRRFGGSSRNAIPRDDGNQVSVFSLKRRFSPEHILSMLEHITLNATKVDIQELGELISKQVCELLKADRALLYLVDEGEKMLWSTDLTQQQIPFGRGIIGHVALTGTAVRLPFQPNQPTQPLSRSRPAGSVSLNLSGGMPGGPLQAMNHAMEQDASVVGASTPDATWGANNVLLQHGSIGPNARNSFPPGPPMMPNTYWTPQNPQHSLQKRQRSASRSGLNSFLPPLAVPPASAQQQQQLFAALSGNVAALPGFRAPHVGGSRGTVTPPSAQRSDLSPSPVKPSQQPSSANSVSSPRSASNFHSSLMSSNAHNMSFNSQMTASEGSPPRVARPQTPTSSHSSASQQPTPTHVSSPDSGLVTPPPSSARRLNLSSPPLQPHPSPRQHQQEQEQYSGKPDPATQSEPLQSQRLFSTPLSAPAALLSMAPSPVSLHSSTPPPPLILPSDNAAIPSSIPPIYVSSALASSQSPNAPTRYDLPSPSASGAVRTPSPTPHTPRTPLSSGHASRRGSSASLTSLPSFSSSIPPVAPPRRFSAESYQQGLKRSPDSEASSPSVDTAQPTYLLPTQPSQQPVFLSGGQVPSQILVFPPPQLPPRHSFPGALPPSSVPSMSLLGAPIIMSPVVSPGSSAPPSPMQVPYGPVLGKSRSSPLSSDALTQSHSAPSPYAEMPQPEYYLGETPSPIPPPAVPSHNALLHTLSVPVATAPGAVSPVVLMKGATSSSSSAEGRYTQSNVFTSTNAPAVVAARGTQSDLAQPAVHHHVSFKDTPVNRTAEPIRPAHESVNSETFMDRMSPQFDPYLNWQLMGFMAHSCLCVPIRSPDDGSIIAVLYTGRTESAEEAPIHDGFPFSSYDVVLLKIFSSHVGVMIRNIKLYEAALRLEYQYNSLVDILTRIPERLQDPDFVPSTLHSLQNLVQAERSSLFLADRKREELWAKDRTSGEEIVIPMNSGLIGHAATTGEMVNVADVNQDKRFDRTVDMTSGVTTTSLLCAPILDEDNEVLGAACFANHRNLQPFAKEEEVLVRIVCNLCSVGLRMPVLKQEVDDSRATYKALVDLAEIMTSKLDTATLLCKLMHKIRELLQCDRSSLFLVDDEKDELWCRSPELAAAMSSPDPIVRFSVWRGIAGHVARHNVSVNSSDVNADKRFYRDIDLLSGYKTRNLLCVPVHDARGKVIAVIEALNKFAEDHPFTSEDEERLKLVSNFIGILVTRAREEEASGGRRLSDLVFCDITATGGLDGLQHHHLRKKTRSRSHPELPVVLENVTVFNQQQHHGGGARAGTFKSSTHVLEMLGKHKNFGRITHLFDFESKQQYSEFTLKRHIPIREALDVSKLGNWDFNALALGPDEIMSYAVTMMEQLQLLDLVPIEKLCNLVSVVSRSYRENLYHNVRHALDTSQAIFAFITQSQRMGLTLNKLDRLSLMIAGFCHDVDHPGVTSSFLIQTSSPLAIFYNDASVLENYHCSVAFLILKDERNNVFERLTPPELKEVRSTMISAIMATDMAAHFTFIQKFRNRIERATPMTGSQEDRQVAGLLAMKCADLAHLIRPFAVAAAWEEVLQEEFFLQGDMERERKLPIGPCNDRQTVNIAESQVFFYNTFGDPLFRAMSDMFPDLVDRHSTLRTNCATWDRKAQRKKKLQQQKAVSPSSGVLAANTSSATISNTAFATLSDSKDGVSGAAVLAAGTLSLSTSLASSTSSTLSPFLAPNGSSPSRLATLSTSSTPLPTITSPTNDQNIVSPLISPTHADGTGNVLATSSPTSATRAHLASVSVSSPLLTSSTVSSFSVTSFAVTSVSSASAFVPGVSLGPLGPLSDRRAAHANDTAPSLASTTASHHILNRPASLSKSQNLPSLSPLTSVSPSPPPKAFLHAAADSVLRRLSPAHSIAGSEQGLLAISEPSSPPSSTHSPSSPLSDNGDDAPVSVPVGLAKPIPHLRGERVKAPRKGSFSTVVKRAQLFKASAAVTSPTGQSALTSPSGTSASASLIAINAAVTAAAQAAHPAAKRTPVVVTRTGTHDLPHLPLYYRTQSGSYQEIPAYGLSLAPLDTSDPSGSSSINDSPAHGAKSMAKPKIGLANMLSREEDESTDTFAPDDLVFRQQRPLTSLVVPVSMTTASLSTSLQSSSAPSYDPSPSASVSASPLKISPSAASTGLFEHTTSVTSSPSHAQSMLPAPSPSPHVSSSVERSTIETHPSGSDERADRTPRTPANETSQPITPLSRPVVDSLLGSHLATFSPSPNSAFSTPINTPLALISTSTLSVVATPTSVSQLRLVTADGPNPSTPPSKSGMSKIRNRPSPISTVSPHKQTLVSPFQAQFRALAQQQEEKQQAANRERAAVKSAQAAQLAKSTQLFQQAKSQQLQQMGLLPHPALGLSAPRTTPQLQPMVAQVFPPSQRLISVNPAMGFQRTRSTPIPASPQAQALPDEGTSLGRSVSMPAKGPTQPVTSTVSLSRESPVDHTMSEFAASQFPPSPSGPLLREVNPGNAAIGAPGGAFPVVPMSVLLGSIPVAPGPNSANQNSGGSFGGHHRKSKSDMSKLRDATSSVSSSGVFLFDPERVVHPVHHSQPLLVPVHTVLPPTAQPRGATPPHGHGPRGPSPSATHSVPAVSRPGSSPTLFTESRVRVSPTLAPTHAFADGGIIPGAATRPGAATPPNMTPNSELLTKQSSTPRSGTPQSASSAGTSGSVTRSLGSNNSSLLASTSAHMSKSTASSSRQPPRLSSATSTTHPVQPRPSFASVVAGAHAASGLHTAVPVGVSAGAFKPLPQSVPSAQPKPQAKPGARRTGDDELHWV